MSACGHSPLWIHISLPPSPILVGASRGRCRATAPLIAPEAAIAAEGHAGNCLSIFTANTDPSAAQGAVAFAHVCRVFCKCRQPVRPIVNSVTHAATSLHSITKLRAAHTKTMKTALIQPRQLRRGDTSAHITRPRARAGSWSRAHTARHCRQAAPGPHAGPQSQP